MNRLFLFISLTLVINSCGLKKASESVCEPLSGVVEKQLIGEIIHDECGWYIRSIAHDPILNLKPCNLPKSHLKEGLKIKFTYQIITTPSNNTTNCAFVIPVCLEEWWAVR